MAPPWMMNLVVSFTSKSDEENVELHEENLVLISRYLISSLETFFSTINRAMMHFFHGEVPISKDVCFKSLSRWYSCSS